MTRDSSSWFERHSRLTITLFFLSGLLLLLILAELGSRVFFPGWAPMTAERAHFWEFDPLLGWRHIPGQQMEFSHPDFTVTATINADGLRDREYSLQRTEKKRMLVLGDSYGWGFGVEDQEVFTELLEQKHPDWEIINASVSGYGTVQEYLYYRDKGYRYQADVVLLLFYDNDFQDNIGETTYWYPKPGIIKNETGYLINEAPLPAPGIRQRIDRYVLGNFYFGRMIYQGISAVVGIANSFFYPPEPMVEENISSLEATRYVLGQWVGLVQAHGAKPVIVQIPLNPEKYSVVSGVCHEYRIACLHLDGVFRKGKLQPWHFPHDRHWNALGHQMAADAVDNFLQQEVIW